MEVEIFPRKGAILGVVWPTEKHWSLCCGVRSKGIVQSSITSYSRRDHSVRTFVKILCFVTTCLFMSRLTFLNVFILPVLLIRNVKISCRHLTFNKKHFGKKNENGLILSLFVTGRLC